MLPKIYTLLFFDLPYVLIYIEVIFRSSTDSSLPRAALLAAFLSFTYLVFWMVKLVSFDGRNFLLLDFTYVQSL